MSDRDDGNVCSGFSFKIEAPSWWRLIRCIKYFFWRRRVKRLWKKELLTLQLPVVRTPFPSLSAKEILDSPNRPFVTEGIPCHCRSEKCTCWWRDPEARKRNGLNW